MSVAEARSTTSPQGAVAQHRGFAVPFIGSLLGGTRVRLGARGTAEFLLPNRHGTRGFLLESWPALRETHGPTLHDLRLVQYLDRLPVLSPPAIQAASHLVAMEGFAGAAASRLARRRERLERNRLARRVTLLRRFAAASGETRWAQSPCASPLGSAGAIAWEAVGIGRVAELTGLGRPEIALCLDDLSRVLPSVGGPAAERSRPARLIALLDECRAEWHEVGRSGGTAPTASLGLRLAEQAGRAVQSAGQLLHGLEEACRDVAALLEMWQRDRTAPAALAHRLDLALDGWERICLLWRDANAAHADAPSEDPTRATLLAELARIACLLPAPSQTDLAAPDHHDPRPIRVGPVRDGASVTRLLRNERIRLAELELDMTDETAGVPQ